MIRLEEYDLADRILFEKESHTPSFMIWEPAGTVVVLGASNSLEDSIVTDNLRKYNARIIKRRSGGQSVVLTGKTLVISIKLKRDKRSAFLYFKTLTGLIIEGLISSGILYPEVNGTSDITLNGKKISGSSIYRNRDFLLFHAVINISEPVSTFDELLKHPIREPDYRKGRKHSEFITSIREEGFDKESEVLKIKIRTKISNYLSLENRRKNEH